MLRNTLQKRLRMECLEDKIALAADLSVAVINGDLVITGDANPNSFIIEKADPDENAQYEIINRGPLGDTINEDTNQNYFVSGVTRDIIINLGGGDDVVRMYGFPDVLGLMQLGVPRDLVINAGSGNDQIYLGVNEDADFGVALSGPINVGRDLVISGGAGNEFISMTDVNVADDLTLVDTQGDIDFQNRFGSEFINGDRSYVADDVTVTTGSGTDTVGLIDMVIGGDAVLTLAGGDDLAGVLSAEIAGNVAVSLGAGTNIAQVEGLSVGGSVGVVASGANTIFVLGVQADSVTVITANNDDFIQFAGVTTGLATIATFGGVDRVEILDSAFDLLIVELGAGNDSLALQNVEVSLLALLSGGRGTDTIEDWGGNDLNLLLDLGFEALV